MTMVEWTGYMCPQNWFGFQILFSTISRSTSAAGCCLLACPRPKTTRVRPFWTVTKLHAENFVNLLYMYIHLSVSAILDKNRIVLLFRVELFVSNGSFAVLPFEKHERHVCTWHVVSMHEKWTFLGDYV